MNESTLTELRILVERAVRPVRASSGRKRKMREEMLAHVSAVFEEEAKLGDENAALQRVIARFGSPAELTKQLQESVPASDRFPRLVEEVVGFPARESTWRRAARHALVVGAMGTVYIAIAILVHSNRSEWLTTARVPSLFASVACGLLTFCGTLIVGAMRQALYGPHGRSWPLAGLISAGAWLFIPLATFTFCLAFTGDLSATFWDVLPTFPLGVWAPVALVLVVRASHPEFCYDREWASLTIDDPKGVRA